jgi:hypothetical protein
MGREKKYPNPCHRNRRFASASGLAGATASRLKLSPVIGSQPEDNAMFTRVTTISTAITALALLAFVTPSAEAQIAVGGAIREAGEVQLKILDFVIAHESEKCYEPWEARQVAALLSAADDIHQTLTNMSWSGERGTGGNLSEVDQEDLDNALERVDKAKEMLEKLPPCPSAFPSGERSPLPEPPHGQRWVLDLSTWGWILVPDEAVHLQFGEPDTPPKSPPPHQPRLDTPGKTPASPQSGNNPKGQRPAQATGDGTSIEGPKTATTPLIPPAGQQAAPSSATSKLATPAAASTPATVSSTLHKQEAGQDVKPAVNPSVAATTLPVSAIAVGMQKAPINSKIANKAGSLVSSVGTRKSTGIAVPGGQTKLIRPPSAGLQLQRALRHL